LIEQTKKELQDSSNKLKKLETELETL